jgi:VCBS repeat-containing protein
MGNTVSTSNGAATATDTSAITLKAASKKIAAGKKVELQVSGSTASNTKLKWKSSNTKYATVSADGVVTTKKAGAGKTVTITAEAADGSGQKATVDIKIMKGTVQKVTASAAKTVTAGKTTTIKTSVKASTGANKKLSFASSNKKYATVSSKGKVTTYKAGKGKTVKITVAATDGSGKKTTVKIKIK